MYAPTTDYLLTAVYITYEVPVLVSARERGKLMMKSDDHNCVEARKLLCTRQ